ncbi:hypothetical protein BDQ94DRAFT_141254 [Aspergillus welwitschiae]|uniref:Uncharacterized protein n=1 Tax=Aspergillus welwitschiae TaxID=1341132 RepID=A0A3F3Q775_9EURO|nr:hypothetical protein BDQ94DRAFT_141254 [Aspergillus welwitschiae]RDH34969.1 hypothetical protein BDQ94DRAFT_141254 [Aspergillus welwitschiae]
MISILPYSGRGCIKFLGPLYISMASISFTAHPFQSLLYNLKYKYHTIDSLDPPRGRVLHF